jgi:hypothetical protein
LHVEPRLDRRRRQQKHHCQGWASQSAQMRYSRGRR